MDTPVYLLLHVHGSGEAKKRFYQPRLWSFQSSVVDAIVSVRRGDFNFLECIERGTRHNPKWSEVAADPKVAEALNISPGDNAAHSLVEALLDALDKDSLDERLRSALTAYFLEERRKDHLAWHPHSTVSMIERPGSNGGEMEPSTLRVCRILEDPPVESSICLLLALAAQLESEEAMCDGDVDAVEEFCLTFCQMSAQSKCVRDRAFAKLIKDSISAAESRPFDAVLVPRGRSHFHLKDCLAEIGIANVSCCLHPEENIDYVKLDWDLNTELLTEGSQVSENARRALRIQTFLMFLNGSADGPFDVLPAERNIDIFTDELYDELTKKVIAVPVQSMREKFAIFKNWWNSKGIVLTL